MSDVPFEGAKFYVIGGEFTDMSFQKIHENLLEKPAYFSTREEAVQNATSRQRAKLDLCLHSVFILEVGQPYPFTTIVGA